MDRSDLRRWWGRTRATLRLTPLPPGERPPPGVALTRMMFATAWAALGVVQVYLFIRAPSFRLGVLAVGFFLFAAYHYARARLLLQAERRD